MPLLLVYLLSFSPQTMKAIKVGQRLYVSGRPKLNPTNPTVLDIVSVAVHILDMKDDVNPPLQVLSTSAERGMSSELSNWSESRFGEVAGAEALTIPSAVGDDMPPFPTVADAYGDTVSMTDSECAVQCGPELHKVHDNASWFMDFDSFPEGLVLFVNDTKSLMAMRDEVSELLSGNDALDLMRSARSNTPLPVVGLDTEWFPDGYRRHGGLSPDSWSHAGEDSNTKRRSHSPVSLLQLATRTPRIYVIDLQTLCRQTLPVDPVTGQVRSSVLGWVWYGRSVLH
jgi:hypothetical protein